MRYKPGNLLHHAGRHNECIDINYHTREPLNTQNHQAVNTFNRGKTLFYSWMN
jgi:hypothetical protein